MMEEPLGDLGFDLSLDREKLPDCTAIVDCLSDPRDSEIPGDPNAFFDHPLSLNGSEDQAGLALLHEFKNFRDKYESINDTVSSGEGSSECGDHVHSNSSADHMISMLQGVDISTVGDLSICSPALMSYAGGKGDLLLSGQTSADDDQEEFSSFHHDEEMCLDEIKEENNSTASATPPFIDTFESTVPELCRERSESSDSNPQTPPVLTPVVVTSSQSAIRPTSLKLSSTVALDSPVAKLVDSPAYSNEHQRQISPPSDQPNITLITPGISSPLKELTVKAGLKNTSIPTVEGPSQDPPTYSEAVARSSKSPTTQTEVKLHSPLITVAKEPSPVGTPTEPLNLHVSPQSEQEPHVEDSSKGQICSNVMDIHQAFSQSKPIGLPPTQKKEIFPLISPQAQQMVRLSQTLSQTNSIKTSTPSAQASIQVHGTPVSSQLNTPQDLVTKLLMAPHPSVSGSQLTPVTTSHILKSRPQQSQSTLVQKNKVSPILSNKRTGSSAISSQTTANLNVKPTAKPHHPKSTSLASVQFAKAGQTSSNLLQNKNTQPAAQKDCDSGSAMINTTPGTVSLGISTETRPPISEHTGMSGVNISVSHKIQQQRPLEGMLQSLTTQGGVRMPQSNMVPPSGSNPSHQGYTGYRPRRPAKKNTKVKTVKEETLRPEQSSNPNLNPPSVGQNVAQYETMSTSVTKPSWPVIPSLTMNNNLQTTYSSRQSKSSDNNDYITAVTSHGSQASLLNNVPINMTCSTSPETNLHVTSTAKPQTVASLPQSSGIAYSAMGSTKQNAIGVTTQGTHTTVASSTAHLVSAPTSVPGVATCTDTSAAIAQASAITAAYVAAGLRGFQPEVSQVISTGTTLPAPSMSSLPQSTPSPTVVPAPAGIRSHTINHKPNHMAHPPYVPPNFLHSPHFVPPSTVPALPTSIPGVSPGANALVPQQTSPNVPLSVPATAITSVSASKQGLTHSHTQVSSTVSNPEVNAVSLSVPPQLNSPEVLQPQSQPLLTSTQVQSPMPNQPLMPPNQIQPGIIPGQLSQSSVQHQAAIPLIQQQPHFHMIPQHIPPQAGAQVPQQIQHIHQGITSAHTQLPLPQPPPAHTQPRQTLNMYPHNFPGHPHYALPPQASQSNLVPFFPHVLPQQALPPAQQITPTATQVQTTVVSTSSIINAPPVHTQPIQTITPASLTSSPELQSMAALLAKAQALSMPNATTTTSVPVTTSSLSTAGILPYQKQKPVSLTTTKGMRLPTSSPAQTQRSELKTPPIFTNSTSKPLGHVTGADIPKTLNTPVLQNTSGSSLTSLTGQSVAENTKLHNSKTGGHLGSMHNISTTQSSILLSHTTDANCSPHSLPLPPPYSSRHIITTPPCPVTTKDRQPPPLIPFSDWKQEHDAPALSKRTVIPPGTLALNTVISPSASPDGPSIDSIVESLESPDQSPSDQKPSDSTKKIIRALTEKLKRKQTHKQTPENEKVSMNEITDLLNESITNKNSSGCSNVASSNATSVSYVPQTTSTVSQSPTVSTLSSTAVTPALSTSATQVPHMTLPQQAWINRPNFPAGMAQGPVAGQQMPLAGLVSGTGPHVPVPGPHVSVTGPHVPMAGPYVSVTGPHVPVAGPYTSVAGPHVSVAGPHVPVAGPHVPVAGHPVHVGGHVPVVGPVPMTGSRLPVAGPHAPLTGPHVPMAGPPQPPGTAGAPVWHLPNQRPSLPPVALPPPPPVVPIVEPAIRPPATNVVPPPVTSAITPTTPATVPPPILVVAPQPQTAQSSAKPAYPPATVVRPTVYDHQSPSRGLDGAPFTPVEHSPMDTDSDSSEIISVNGDKVRVGTKRRRSSNLLGNGTVRQMCNSMTKLGPQQIIIPKKKKVPTATLR